MNPNQPDFPVISPLPPAGGAVLILLSLFIVLWFYAKYCILKAKVKIK